MDEHGGRRRLTIYLSCAGACTGIPCSLLCLFFCAYIYRHQPQPIWLFAIAAFVLAAGFAAAWLIYMLPALKKLGGLLEESRASGACVQKPGELVSLWTECVREKNKTSADPHRQEDESSYVQSEINALQSQMNPHFLYNTLDSIRGQAMSIGAAEIADMTEALSSFFRYSISQKGAIVTLRDELKNVDAYMQIQSFRFENRIKLRIVVDEGCDPQELYVPKMILQPIVENCIVHGLEEKEGPGLVTVRITQTDKRLLISVSDDGRGMESQALARLNESISEEPGTGGMQGKSGGIALRNVNRRIFLHYGKHYGITARSMPGIGTEIGVSLPVVDINNVPPQYLKLTN